MGIDVSVFPLIGKVRRRRVSANFLERRDTWTRSTSSSAACWASLIEKQLSQPQYYPLTLNALVNGCNQKSNRDPTMELDEATVYDTLEELRGRDLISRVLAGAGSRTDRFRHDLGRTVGWQTPQLAIMAELLLRGPQTVGELRSRCARMHPFASIDAVAETLESLAGGDSPAVTAMPREPGRSAIRHRHLLYEAGEAPQAQSATVGGITAAPPHATSASPAQVAANPQ